MIFILKPYNIEHPTCKPILKLAYIIAKRNFIKDGNNRVILVTDGCFKEGQSIDAAMGRLIKGNRNDSVFLSVLGFGMGNYKDSKIERLSDLGNGNYASINTIYEAKKALGKEFLGEMYTIAKDVEIQVEFNPAMVKSYRLIGYENRKLKQGNFNINKKNTGDIDAGHTVTAIYEVVPTTENDSFEASLKYRKTVAVESDNLLTLRLRYKNIDEEKSNLIEKTVKREDLEKFPSENFRWAMAVTELGMLLRKSQFKANASFENVLKTAKESKGNDQEGYRADFIKLVEMAKLLSD